MDDDSKRRNIDEKAEGQSKYSLMDLISHKFCLLYSSLSRLFHCASREGIPLSEEGRERPLICWRLRGTIMVEGRKETSLTQKEKNQKYGDGRLMESGDIRERRGERFGYYLNK